jgi:hypothetical protein
MRLLVRNSLFVSFSNRCHWRICIAHVFRIKLQACSSWIFQRGDFITLFLVLTPDILFEISKCGREPLSCSNMSCVEVCVSLSGKESLLLLNWTGKRWGVFSIRGAGSLSPSPFPIPGPTSVHFLLLSRVRWRGVSGACSVECVIRAMW